MHARQQKPFFGFCSVTRFSCRLSLCPFRSFFSLVVYIGTHLDLKMVLIMLCSLLFLAFSFERFPNLYVVLISIVQSGLNFQYTGVAQTTQTANAISTHSVNELLFILNAVVVCVWQAQIAFYTVKSTIARLYWHLQTKRIECEGRHFIDCRQQWSATANICTMHIAQSDNTTQTHRHTQLTAASRHSSFFLVPFIVFICRFWLFGIYFVIFRWSAVRTIEDSAKEQREKIKRKKLSTTIPRCEWSSTASTNQNIHSLTQPNRRNLKKKPATAKKAIEKKKRETKNDEKKSINRRRNSTKKHGEKETRKQTNKNE